MLPCAAMAQFGVSVPQEKRQVVTEVRKADKPNRTDALGRKQGAWGRKYPNGRYMYEANFVDDKPVGTVVRYHENGKKSAELAYGESDTVSVVYYDEMGQKSAEGRYVGKVRVGQWTYFARKAPISVENYIGGKLHGVVTVYFDNGNVAETTNYVNGVKQGEWLTYHRNGRIRTTAFYIDGETQGHYSYLSDAGLLLVEGQYDKGELVGDWKVYDDDKQEYFYMKYDARGNLTNADEVDARMSERMERYEAQRDNLRDPADYVNTPELYVP